MTLNLKIAYQTLNDGGSDVLVPYSRPAQAKSKAKLDVALFETD